MQNRSAPNDPLVYYRALSFMCILIVLNVLDAVFTIIGIESGVFVEINPLMDYLLGLGTWSYFFCSKMALCIIGNAILFSLRSYNGAFWGNMFAIMLYVAVLINHLCHYWML